MNYFGYRCKACGDVKNLSKGAYERANRDSSYAYGRMGTNDDGWHDILGHRSFFADCLHPHGVPWP